ncbi:MAG: DEAD/DEAH box helicase [Candidatus Paceibacterota bacterium]|jgi:superfamily II DNA/RNA helicase
MYRRNNSRSSSSRSYGRGGYQGGGNHRGGNSGGGQRRTSNQGRTQNIHFSKFINKAEPLIAEVAYISKHKFSDFSIDLKIKENITKKGFSTPTPIQDQIIPQILAGRDVVGIANTGTGKTGAFLIPLIQKALINRNEKVLIVVPTRELALQINQELRTLVLGMPVYSVCCVGGVSIGGQISELRNRSSNFIIGTPGRLKDLVNRRFIDLSKFATIVLDEADRMLDMGFIADMKFVMAKMPKHRHTLFFSATISREIEILIKDFLTNPITISVKTGDTAKSVDQDIVRVNGNKLDTLHDILNKEEFYKVLIFGRTKHGVEKLSKNLIARGFKADSIHGDKNHAKRQKALSAFKDEYINILVATDVAARGLDIPDISHVINYDLPATYDDYVHRIGRTGRGNKKGKALTFIE